MTGALTDAFARRGIACDALPAGGAVPRVFTSAPLEHHATRTAATIFDFSFMGCWSIAGKGAAAMLERLQTRRIGLLADGQLAYTLMLRDDGTVFNDATVWRFAPDRFCCFAGRRSDAAWIAEAAGRDAAVTDLADRQAVIALQGPRSASVLARLVGDRLVAGLRYFRFSATRVAPFGELLVARLGYSGELGFEIVVDAARATELWSSLVALGAREAGFAAADTLRIESGYVLFANELARPRTPRALALARLVDSTAATMRGRAACRRDEGVRLVGFTIDAARAGARPVAELTSECRSPTLAASIGLGFVDAADARPGMRVRLGDGRLATVRRLPHYDPPRARPRVVLGDPPRARPRVVLG